MNLRLGLAAVAMMAVSAHLMGCGPSGLGGCGVGPSPGPNNQNGVVTFDTVAVGSSQQLPVSFQDSNPSATETITGVTISGPDAAAFQVVSTFPIQVAAGAQVTVEIKFAPTHVGSSSATLVLDTEEMGPSPVQVEGTGE